MYLYLFVFYLPASLPLLFWLLPSLPQICTKRHCFLKSLQYITFPPCLPYLSLLSLLSSFTMCAGLVWVSHISWLCFRNHRARVFLWSQLLKACSVLLHLRQGICWRVSEDPRLLPQSPSSLALFFNTLYLFVWFISWVLYYSIWLFIKSVTVSGSYTIIVGVQMQGPLEPSFEIWCMLGKKVGNIWGIFVLGGVSSTGYIAQYFSHCCLLNKPYY